MSSVDQEAPAGGQPTWQLPLAPRPLPSNKAVQPIGSFPVTPEQRKRNRDSKHKRKLLALIGQESCAISGRHSDWWRVHKIHFAPFSLLSGKHKDIGRHFTDSIGTKNLDRTVNTDLVCSSLHSIFDGADGPLGILGSGHLSYKLKDMPGMIDRLVKGLALRLKPEQIFQERLFRYDVYMFANMHYYSTPIYNNAVRRPYPDITRAPRTIGPIPIEPPTRHDFVTGCQGFDRVNHTNPVFTIFDYAVKMRYRLKLQHVEDQSVGIPLEDILEFNEVIWPAVSHWFGEAEPGHVHPPPKAKRAKKCAPQAPLSPTAADTAGDEEAHRALFGGPAAAAPSSADADGPDFDASDFDDLPPNDLDSPPVGRMPFTTSKNAAARKGGVRTAPEKGRNVLPMPKRPTRSTGAVGTTPATEAPSGPSLHSKVPTQPTRRQPKRTRSQAGIREASAAAAMQASATDKNDAAAAPDPSALPSQDSSAPTRVGVRELRPRKRKSQVLTGAPSTTNEAGPSKPQAKNARRATDRTDEDSDDEPLPARKKPRIRRRALADNFDDDYIPPPAFLRDKDSDEESDKGKKKSKKKGRCKGK
ncbi:hypothetical protein BD626DRAFT_631857 [Schizophyllum amplum]|uniref:Uncharacterized protein n=1 Tax=Schizophyllum amplum TaxID=97359 RepID=A0A550C9F8_9AGAR|nr:hypothetical protein BD626DRAFT_631857 [Auriculariopsis ampla]